VGAGLSIRTTCPCGFLTLLASCSNEPSALNPAYPSLRSLSGGYIRNQLRLFRDGARGGGTYRDLMARAVKDLIDADVEALAHYFDDRGMTGSVQ
jgi:cytochrome c553